MRVRLNGERRDLEQGATVADAVAACAIRPDERGIAVALEGEVVPRAAWAATPLADGAHLEIVRATAGG